LEAETLATAVTLDDELEEGALLAELAADRLAAGVEDDEAVKEGA